jgi:tetratricopeptide (TPR) repeat protein
VRQRAFLLTAVLAVLLAGTPHLAAAAQPSRADERPISPAAIRHYLQARLLAISGELHGALSELRVALAFDEDASEVRLAYAELLAATGELPRAEAEARRALAGNPGASTVVRARLLAGRVAAEQRAWKRAAGELGEATKVEAALAREERRPPRALAWRTLALVRDAAGDEAGAARAVEELAALLPAEAGEVWVDLGDAARAGGELSRATRFYRRAVALTPRLGEAWKRLAALQERAGATAEARAAWEGAVRAEPDDEDALLGAGRLAATERDLTAAKAWFAQLGAVAANPDAARVGIALAWLDAGDQVEAIALLDRAAAEDRPTDARVLFALGTAEERVGRMEAAIARMREVLMLDPAHGEAMNFIAYAFAERGERLEEAEALARGALARDPESAAFLDTLGWVELRRGRLPAAVEALERAERIAGADAIISEHLGDAYRKSGRAVDATAAYRRALAAVGPREPTQREGIEKKLEELVSLR